MRAMWILVALGGCSTVDDGFGVRIEARGAPVVVFQNGDGAWQRVATTVDGVGYVQAYDGGFGVGALCASSFAKTARFVFDTEPRTVYLDCPVDIPVTGTPRVTGRTEPMTEVWIANRSVRADANGLYSAQVVSQGLHDVIAVLPGTPPRIAIQRAIAITGDTGIDLPATAARDMIAITPTVIGGDPETLVVTSDLNTDTDWVSFGEDPTTAYAPPPELLLSSDHPAIAARDANCSRQIPFAAASSPIVMPSAFDFTIDRAHATWTADPDVAWAWALLDVNSFANDSYVSTYASASWRAAMSTDVIPIVDLATLPGWTGGLARIVPDEPADYSFYISRGDYGGDHTGCGAHAAIDHW